jgi:hypothetical protein
VSAANALIDATISWPRGTARLPPGQKSFLNVDDQKRIAVADSHSQNIA